MDFGTFTFCCKEQSLSLKGLLLVIVLWSVVSSGYAADYSPELPAAQWGIEVVSLRLTAAGNVVDFRYKVVDPEKAAYILNRNHRGYLVEEASGRTFAVPNTGKVGALRQSTLAPEAGRVYFMLFGNANRILKSGSKVTVVVGDARIPGLVIN